MKLRIEYLNHASVLIELGPVRLLSDPWLEGSCFSGGWGLCYENPDALAIAQTATHLWISHWHSDHLHAPTLEKLAAGRPDMIVLANVSANFSMVERLRGFGFRDVRAMPERKLVQLTDDLQIIRYPTAGIDNMLLLRGLGWSILNYNDCNLTAAAARAVCSSLGPIDLLLTNYNYAGKLFEHESPSIERDKLASVLAKLTDIMQARHVVPFASAHYFRTQESREQNALLLDFPDLEERFARDGRFNILRVGDALSLQRPGAEPRYDRRSPALVRAMETTHDYGSSVPWEELEAAADARCRKLRSAFFGVGAMLPPLHIEVSDYRGRGLTLDGRRGASPRTDGPWHIAAHSQALIKWLGQRFGDDTFFAGAHFELRDADTLAIRRWALITLLEASHLDPRSALRYLASSRGLWFLWCRREEIRTSLSPRAFRAAQLRL
jgi:L-ascorbate metabolism protein UlaG (beta-lactamase superfamily)